MRRSPSRGKIAGMSKDAPDYRTASEYFADKAHDERWQRTHGEWAPDLPPPMIDGKMVHIVRINPPVPSHKYDWQATIDSYEPGDPIGHGATKEGALQDLREQCEERDE